MESEEQEERLVDRVGLENGLVLELYDGSRVLAGDRWLVLFVARMEVAVAPPSAEETKAVPVTLKELRALLGDSVFFRYEKKSHFVTKEVKDAVYEQLKKDFLESNLPYLSSPDFPSKLILRRYREARGDAVRWARQ